ncbi:hypothetical protein Tco_0766465, partial [Tanacetum coccineum]
MEEDYKPTVQHQRRVSPKIDDVIKKEVEKLLDAGLIYLISDSPRLPERPLPSSLHGPNARKTRGKPILLFPRWLLGLFPDS